MEIILDSTKKMTIVGDNGYEDTKSVNPDINDLAIIDGVVMLTTFTEDSMSADPTVASIEIWPLASTKKVQIS